MEASLLLMGASTFAEQSDENGNNLLPAGLCLNMGLRTRGFSLLHLSLPVPHSHLNHLLLYGFSIYPFSLIVYLKPEDEPHFF